jgi:hypothetical protein
VSGAREVQHGVIMKRLNQFGVVISDGDILNLSNYFYYEFLNSDNADYVGNIGYDICPSLSPIRPLLM